MDIKKISTLFGYVIFLTPLFFFPFGAQIFEIPQQLFLVAAVSLLLFTSALFFFPEKWTFYYQKNITWLAILIFFSLFISATLSISPVESFFGSFERGQGLFTQIIYLLLFLILTQVLQKKAGRDKVLLLIIGVGTVLSVLAILQIFGLDITGINNLAQTSGRPFATLGQPNLLGQWLIVPILGAHFLLMQKQIIKKSLRDFLWVGLAINFAALLLTQNKATFLALAVSLVILFFYKKFKKIYLIFAVLLVTLLGGLFIMSGRSLSSRLISWGSSITPIIERPIFGHGQETYYLTAQQTIDPKVFLYEDPYTTPDRLHNFVLQTLHDYGLFGFLVLLLVVIFLVKSFQKNSNDHNLFPAITLIAFSFTLLFSFSLTANMVIFCYIMALFVVTTCQFNKAIISNSILKIFTLVIITFFASIALLNQFRTFSINNYLANGLETLMTDQNSSRQQFNKIITLDPPYRFIHYSIINLLSSHYSPELDKSLSSLGNITNKSFYYFIASARIHHAKGDLPATFADLDQAARLAPNFVLIYQLHGHFAFLAGDYPEAIRQLEKVLQIMPPFWRKDHVTDFASSEQNRIFQKNHPEFGEILRMLFISYNETGQKERAQELLDSVSR